MDPGVTLTSLSASLDNLEEVLEPLIAKTLSQNTETLKTIDKAKLQVLVAYVIQDLVLIYLKTRGLDPAKHAVTEELNRVKSYFEKISSAENPQTRGWALDKAAANRFIKAAINEAKAASEEASSHAGAGPSSQRTGNNVDVVIPFGKHTRFTHIKPPRNERPENSDESSGDDDDEVKIVDDVKSLRIGKEPEDTVPPPPPKNLPSGSTKRRRAMDPFAGTPCFPIISLLGTGFLSLPLST
ncbi:hypothetical protein BS47DRAFT_1297226 [Hydnum rufescens UP504]|uniref:Exosome complex protein n=1 Tax=Hydnum rufescens UP504 TaxID=1448309 RepID=A0A9P6AW53_9AGAM|nr:hypothetical protein BS47DRAFT_1297226 [Hydnum rufescens UP504]